MVELYFIYGLAFFSLGLCLLIRQAPDGAAELRPGFRLLAYFGLIHGVQEWLVMASLTGGVTFGDLLESEAGIAVVGGVSFLALFAGGVRLAAISFKPLERWVRILPYGVVGAWIVGAIAMTLGILPAAGLDYATRWLAGAPGALLAAWGLASAGRRALRGDAADEGDALSSVLRGAAFATAAGALGVYGASTFFGPTLSIFPASLINAELFQETLRLPVQSLRTLAAIILTSAMLAILRGFMTMDRAGLETAVREATENLRANEARLAESEQRFRGVFETNLVATIIIDAKRRIIGFNAAASELLGYAENEAVGHQMELIMPEPYRSQHAANVQRYLDGGEAKIIGVAPRLLPALHKSGTVIQVWIDVVEIRSERGLRMFVGTLTPAGEDEAED
jgi:PAS domain S-box-containing protein